MRHCGVSHLEFAKPFMKMKKLDVLPPLVKTKTVSIILEASISLIIIATNRYRCHQGKSDIKFFKWGGAVNSYLKKALFKT